MSGDALDGAALDRLRRIGGDKLLVAMLESFLANGAQRVAEASGSAEAGDGAGVSDAAHALKSSAGNVGARRLQETSARVEFESRSGGVDLRALASELDTAWQEARAAARSLLDAPG